MFTLRILFLIRKNSRFRGHRQLNSPIEYHFGLWNVELQILDCKIRTLNFGGIQSRSEDTHSFKMMIHWNSEHHKALLGQQVFDSHESILSTKGFSSFSVAISDHYSNPNYHRHSRIKLFKLSYNSSLYFPNLNFSIWTVFRCLFTEKCSVCSMFSKFVQTANYLSEFDPHSNHRNGQVQNEDSNRCESSSSKCKL